jgi:pyruvate dehydrogenase E2 component (dihydrolipoamide acetyltransferase)
VAIEFKLPELGENIESGDVVRVAVAPGDTVSEGQPVVELETDKAVIEVPSTVSGKVTEVRVKEGQKLRVGDLIFVVDGAGEAAAPAKPAPAEAPQPKAETPKPVEAKREEAPAPKPVETPKATPVATAPVSGEVVEFKLPELGENIEGGDVVRVLVEAGKSVNEGDPVVELETDKAVVEVPSTVGGVVKKVIVQQGQKAKVGQVLFTLAIAELEPAAHVPEPEPISTQGEDYHSSSSIAREVYQSARKVEGKTEREAFPPDAVRHEQHVIPPSLAKDAGTEHRPPAPASPLVRRLARELGIDIHEVKGSGPGGRIFDSDVRAFAKSIITGGVTAPGVVAMAPATHAAARPAIKLPDFSKWGEVEVVSMRPVRRKTAEHLSDAWTTIPHVTQFDKADVTELEELRKRFAPKAEMAGGKMTMTAIALKVLASALKAFPQFNASIDLEKQEIIYKRYIHLGVAVDTDRGLLVPVVRNVDQKNIIEIAAELAAISKKARDKKLTTEDMEGGTFTISNLGGIGGTSFTPIVNHPEVAILGMSRGRMEPVWMNDKFEPRMMLPLSLSYDHRLIDGADAARFLRWVVEAFEQPFLLSVQG